MSATVTFSRRNRALVLTLTLPAAAICAGVAGILSVRHRGSDATPDQRVPIIRLVQPDAGGTILQDRPVVIFRVASAHEGDPIDAASFRVALDGDDRTEGFQLTDAEAWGSLAGRAGAAVSVGSHVIEARVCSVRGICATATNAIVVRPAGWYLPSSLCRRTSPAPVRRSLLSP